jgi:hypothetical protein
VPRRSKQLPPPTSITAPPGRPLFEVNPEARLVAALAEAFGPFTPGDRAWYRVECAMKSISVEADTAGHDAFCRGFPWMQADDVIGFLVKHGLVEDRYQRAADGMNASARKILVVMISNGATKQSDYMTRSLIEELTGLSQPQVKAAIEGDIRRASATLGADILQTKVALGTWLSSAGIEVANRIDAKIVKRFDT